MSAIAGADPDDSFRNGLAAEDLAPIAAVDGLGALAPEQAAGVDMRKVGELEAASGALFSAFALEKRGLQEMPPEVLERMQTVAQSHVANGTTSIVATAHPNQARPKPADRDSSAGSPDGGAQPFRAGWQLGPVAAVAGWAAAAALLAGFLTTMGRVSDLEQGLVKLEPKTQLARFQLTAADVIQLAWLPLGPESNVKGEVVWSDDSNDGFMRINGLPVNDPEQSQYQLWIFRGDDPAAEPHPVDGGVFDVAAGEEVIIPIEAKLYVGHAGTFAVTVEKPGGVVVSGRDQIVALAQRAS